MSAKLSRRNQCIPNEAWDKFKQGVLKKEEGDVTLSAQKAERFLAKRAKKT